MTSRHEQAVAAIAWAIHDVECSCEKELPDAIYDQARAALRAAMDIAADTITTRRCGQSFCGQCVCREEDANLARQIGGGK